MKGQQFINNQWVLGEGREFFSFNPVNDHILWRGNSASAKQVENAIMAARDAFPEWSLLSAKSRFGYIERFTKLIQKNKDELAELISLENGKPLWDAATEVAAMMGKARISFQAYEQRTGSYTKTVAQGQLTVNHKPHGVLAVFGPYNFPAHLPNGHIVPALLAGNCVVFKPSELTPAIAEKTVELWLQAGLPKGVLNMVQGDKTVGTALSQSAQLDGILFTGSAQTGTYLHQQYAGQPEKILALEMGGNNPLVIEEVQNKTAALFITLFSAFVSSGQRCTCARRLLLPSGTWGDQFIESLVTVTEKLEVGDGCLQPQPFMGAVINTQAVAMLQQGIEQLENSGGKILLRSHYLNPNGTLMTPTLVEMSAVAHDYDQELFGPVLHIYRYSDLDEAIQLCNNTRYGLAAGIVTDNSRNARTFVNRVRAGIVNVNKPLTGASSEAPFGGVGISGNGRPSAYYAADYCTFPVATLGADKAELPANIPPGLEECLRK